MSKRILTLLLAALTALASFAITSCSSKPEPEMSRVTHVYKSTDVELPDNLNTGDMYLTDEGLLIRCTEIVSEDPYKTREVMLTLDLETGEYTTEPIPQMEENVYINSILPLSDGSALYITLKYDEEAMTQQYRVEKYENGALTILCEDVEPLFETKAEDLEIGFGDFYLQNIQVDGDGNIIVATDALLGVFDPTMKKLFEIELTGWLDSMGATADGRVYVQFYDRQNGGQVFKYIDVAARGFGEDVAVPDSNNFRNAQFYIGPGYDMYINDGSSVYGYNEGSEPVELLNWVNSDIIQNGIQDVVIIDEDTFVANYYEYNEDAPIRELYILNRIPDEDVPERYIIDLAVNYASYDLPSQIVKFNRSNDQYRIRLIDYEQYNTQDDYQLAETTLYNDITAKNAPDIIQLANFSNANMLIENNVFLDLYELMDDDETFDRSTLFNSVLEPFEHDGELPQLVTELSISTLAGKSENMPGEHWTVDEFLDWAEQLDEKQYPFNYTNSLQMFNTLLCCSLDQFIDTEKGTVNFDNDTFRRMLEYSKNTAQFNYRDTLSGDALADYENDRYKTYRENTILLQEAYIMDLGSLVDAMFAFGFKDTTFIGYPSNDSGVVVHPNNSFAITKDSLVAEGAWEFIKSVFENANASRGAHNISSNRDVFRKSTEQDMKMHYFYYYDGGRSGSSSDDFVGRYDESMGIYRDFTEADVELMEKLIDGATAIPSYAEKVVELAMEDFEMYFAGDKTLDETIDIVQNRVGRYIAENN